MKQVASSPKDGPKKRGKGEYRHRENIGLVLLLAVRGRGQALIARST